MLSLGTGYVISEWLIRIAMLFYLPQRRDPASARAWLLLTFFLPLLGLALYILIGRAYVPRRRLERQARSSEMIESMPERLGWTPPAQASIPAAIASSVRLSRNLGDFDVSDGNAVELLDNYRNSLERLLSDIDQAQSTVHLLYYIFADDSTGQKATEVIERAAKRGVQCRVLMDAMGSRGALRHLAPRLRAAGVEVIALLPLRVLRRGRLRLDLRNHRKIAVIDGRIGYVGSQNIVDEGANRGLSNEELVARLVGPVVQQLQAVLLSDRYQEVEREIARDSGVFPAVQPAGDSAAQVLPSGPGHQSRTNQEVLVDLIYRAQKRVVLTTPYFVPEATFLGAMRTAAARGVEIDLVVSWHSNKPVVQFAQQSYYEDLLDAGVRIHLYRAAFLHAKHVSIDDTVAVIGSSNLDIRSFALNNEVSLLVYDPAVVAKLRAIQDRYFAHSEVITLEQWRRRSPVRRWLQNMCRLTDTLI